MREKWTDHFYKDETVCPCGCGKNDMSQEYMDWLETVRVEAGIPFFLNSAFRCPQHNSDTGGVEDSEHCHGTAVDVKVNGGLQRFVITKAAMKLGVFGLGVAKTFIHLDRGKVKPRPMVWSY